MSICPSPYSLGMFGALKWFFHDSLGPNIQ